MSVDTIISLREAHGQSEKGAGFLISDRQEAWLVEMTTDVWAATKIKGIIYSKSYQVRGRVNGGQYLSFRIL